MAQEHGDGAAGVPRNGAVDLHLDLSLLVGDAVDEGGSAALRVLVGLEQLELDVVVALGGGLRPQLLDGQLGVLVGGTDADDDGGLAFFHGHSFHS